MPQPIPHDTPAGRTLAEHRALHALLGEIEEASVGAGAAETLPSHLDTLRDQLASHFEGEESGGLFEQITEEAPEQVHECQKLCDQHTELLERIDELRAADGEARADPSWGQSVRAVLKDLAEHEATENELLSRALDGSMEAQD